LFAGRTADFLSEAGCSMAGEIRFNISGGQQVDKGDVAANARGECLTTNNG